MKRLLIEEAKKGIGRSVKVAGFIQTIRDQGSIKFLILRDISGIIQAVVLKDKVEAIKTAETLSLESVVEIEGLVKEEKQAPGGVEIAVETLTVLSAAKPELPIPILEKASNEADIEKRLNWRWLDLRRPDKALVFKVWTLMEEAFRDYWLKNNYLEIHSPKLMATPSESGAELFEVQYFERKAYLAQSPQFYKQMARAAGLEKVFEVGPVFRAEPSFTTRHATEFTGYDAEISFIESHEDVMAEEEKILRSAFEKIKEKFGEEIKKYYDREVVVPELPFPRLTMKEAKETLAKIGVPSEKEGDFNPEEERKLSEYIRETKNHEFVFVTEYPVEVRPFYHMRLESNPRVTKSFDLLYNGVEIATGAEREHRYEVLLSQAEEKGLSLKPLEFYLNFFKYGCPPHGGFGMGPSRILMKLFDVASVREAMFLYRGVKRLEP